MFESIPFLKIFHKTPKPSTPNRVDNHDAEMARIIAEARSAAGKLKTHSIHHPTNIDRRIGNRQSVGRGTRAAQPRTLVRDPDADGLLDPVSTVLLVNAITSHTDYSSPSAPSCDPSPSYSSSYDSGSSSSSSSSSDSGSSSSDSGGGGSCD